MKNLLNWKLIRQYLFTFLIMMGGSLLAQEKMEKEASVSKNINDPSIEWGSCPDFMPSGCNVAILHGDPSASNADAIFKIQPNTDIPEHWHSSAERMILLEGELDITYEGEETQKLKKGHYIYGPAKKAHSARCKGETPCLHFIAFVKPVDAFKGTPKGY